MGLNMASGKVKLDSLTDRIVQTSINKSVKIKKFLN